VALAEACCTRQEARLTLSDVFGNYQCILTPAPPDNSSGLPISSIQMSITYAGPPTLLPPAISDFVVDVNGRTWVYWGGQWN